MHVQRQRASCTHPKEECHFRLAAGWYPVMSAREARHILSTASRSGVASVAMILAQAPIWLGNVETPA